MKNLLLVTLLFAGLSVSAQNQDSVRRVALGVSFFEIKWDQVNQVTNPPQKITFTIDPLPLLRLDTRFGINKSGQKSNGVKAERSSTTHGVGLYYVLRKERFNYLIGGSIENTISRDISSGRGANNQWSNREVNKFLSGGPEIQGEYYLSDRFSLTASAGVKAIRTKSKRSSNGQVWDRGKYGGWQTDSSIIMRFYL